MNEEIEILKEFLKLPLWTSDDIFNKFKEISGYIYRENADNKQERFLYIEGTKSSKVVLIAHADTYFDENYGFAKVEHQIFEKNGFIYSKNNSDVGLGADDRAGCAILWILKESGHSILVTDGEEHGSKGSNWLINNNSDIADKINSHQFMIQLDRGNSNDYKCYSVGSDEFRDFLNKKTGYIEPDLKRRSDIVTLCKKICGVNFSIGYYDDHKKTERINLSEWQKTLNMIRKLINNDLPKFELKKSV